jgi:hypothetical protein
MTGSKNRRISKIKGNTQDDMASRQPHCRGRRKNLALPVTQFTGPDAPRSPHHAQARARMASKGVPEDGPNQSEIVNDTLAARRFRLLAPLAVLLALVALALAPGIIGIM